MSYYKGNCCIGFHSALNEIPSIVNTIFVSFFLKMKTFQTVVLFISVNYINPSKCTFLYLITSKVTFSTNINKVVVYIYNRYSNL